MASTASASASTKALDADTSTSTKSSGRSHLNEASTMINRGGIGHAPSSLPSYNNNPTTTPPDDILRVLDLYESNFLPHRSRSLSGIALRSFILGITLTLSTILTLYLLSLNLPIWRLPFFLTSLSLFHFLEFWTTSRANTGSATIASFLLSSNGSAYTIAHSLSLLETLISHLFLPPLLPPFPHYLSLITGLLLMILGQAIRAKAMLTAGKSFSHIVAHTKKTTHDLITTGVYSVFRHPSYFGYFWWAVGTQLVCGNMVCLVGYAVVLFQFFRKRIEGEEELLIRFFGDEYVAYKARTWVGIPFIK